MYCLTRWGALGLAVAAFLFLASCRSIADAPRPTQSVRSTTTVPQPAESTQQLAAAAFATPGIEAVPEGKYLFVEWKLAISDHDASQICRFAPGELPPPVYAVMGNSAEISLAAAVPEGTIGFAGTEEHVIDLGGQTVSPIPSVPFTIDEHAKVVRVKADSSVIVELFRAQYQIGAGKDLNIHKQDVVWGCRVDVHYQFINHGWLDAANVTIYTP